MFDRFEQIYTIVLLYHLLVSSMSKTQRRILINEIQKSKNCKTATTTKNCSSNISNSNRSNRNKFN